MPVFFYSFYSGYKSKVHIKNSVEWLYRTPVVFKGREHGGSDLPQLQYFSHKCLHTVFWWVKFWKIPKYSKKLRTFINTYRHCLTLEYEVYKNNNIYTRKYVSVSGWGVLSQKTSVSRFGDLPRGTTILYSELGKKGFVYVFIAYIVYNYLHIIFLEFSLS